MGLLRKLFSVKPNNASPKVELGPEVLEQVDQMRAAMSGTQADRFDFQENLVASPGDTSGVGKHRPRAGTAYIEVLAANGEVLASDTVEATPAPKHAGKLGYNNEIKCTYVVIGETGQAQQEFTAPLGDVAGLSFHVPAHLKSKDKVGGTTLRVWWSCDE